MNGTPAAKARRNLIHTNDRAIWEQTHSENHPLRYRLYCDNGAYNIRSDRLALIREIGEARPHKIERLLPKDEKIDILNPLGGLVIGILEVGV